MTETKDQILERIREAIPFHLPDRIRPYTEEAMQTYADQQLILSGVSNSALLEELRVKLIGMECFADEYYNEDAKAGCKTIVDELKDWINQKRV